jgi:hypothetical protein
MKTVKNVMARIIVYLPEAVLGIIVNVLWMFTLGLYKFSFEFNWIIFINKRLMRGGWLNRWFYRI